MKRRLLVSLIMLGIATMALIFFSLKTVPAASIDIAPITSAPRQTTDAGLFTTQAHQAAMNPAPVPEAGKLSQAETWQSSANQTVTQTLNRPEFLQKLAMNAWACKDTRCEFSVSATSRTGAMGGAVSALMSALNDDLPAASGTRAGLIGMTNGPEGPQARLVYQRDIEPPARYSAKQMMDAMTQSAEFQKQQDSQKN